MKRLTLIVITHLFIASFLYANIPNSTIKGKVLTSDGDPAVYVTISVKGSKRMAFTDENGIFIIKNMPAGSHELEISLTGYETLKEKVEVGNDATAELNIRLQLTQKQLQEVVIKSGRRKFTRSSSDYVAKIPLKNMENPQVYNSITRELLTDQMVFTVDDAVKNAPGLQRMWDATGRSGDGGAYYNARGFVVQSQLRNGVAGNVTSTIDAANIESIEVLKGPSATLFGSSLTSYGGVINRVTKKPLDAFKGEISYAAGSYGYNRIAADVNIPLDAEKKVLFRLNTAYKDQGSFQDNGFEKGWVLAPSLSYQVNDRLSFLFDAELYHGSNSSKQMIFFYFPSSQLGATRADQLGIDYKRSYSAPDIFQTSATNNLFGQMNYKLSDKWTSQTNFTSSRSFSDGPGAYYYVVPNSVVTGDPSATGADYLARADQSTSNNSVQVTEIQQNFIGEFYLGKMRNRFVGGLDYFIENSNQLFYGVDPFDIILKNGVIPNYTNFNRDKLDSALQNGEPWRYPYSFRYSTYSAYASDLINLTDGLMAMAALRVDHYDNKGSFDQSSGQYNGGYKQTALSPKFGLVYQPILNRVSLFANYQNGFTNQTGADSAGKTFKPEQANQIEGGIKIDFLSGRLTSTISYYNIEVKDLVRADPAHPNFSIQDGTQLSKGIEAEIIANPFPGLNIVAGFSYNDSKYTRSDKDVEGRRPATAMSPYTANFWMSYRVPRGKWQGFGAGIGGNYASDNKIVNSVYYGEFILPAYTVLNATVYYDQPKFRVGVKMDNLTNQEYWIGYTTMNPQPLRGITGSIAFKF